MKAIQIHNYGGVEELVYEEIPQPSIAPDEVLIKVYASGVNPVDWKIREGLRKTVFPTTLPLTPGWDLSGVIESVGTEVNEFKKGDEVYSRPNITRNGSYAEYTAVKASEVAHKPKTIDHITAAAIPLAGLTAWQALFDHGKLQPGQKVLIIGASGGVGHFAVQFAKWKGANVIAVCSSKNVDFVRTLKADQIIDYKTTRYEDTVKDVDLVFDVAGGDTKPNGWKVLKKGGIFVSITGKPETNVPEAEGKTPIGFTVLPNKEQLIQIAKLVDEGIVKPVVSIILPLSDARKAQDMLQHGKNLRGKIVLKIIDNY
jgi:NADPH:quinone reductase-like Zn-dependent oxidoreductase